MSFGTALRPLVVLGMAVLGVLVVPLNAVAQRPLGIDVSHWQGTDIDWVSVKNSGVTFAFCKATEGTNFTDNAFVINEVNAKAAGVLIGAYHFARYDTHLGTAGANLEADWFWTVAKNYITNNGAYLMPMLDVEHAPGTNYTKTTLSQWVNQWCVSVSNKANAVGIKIRPVIYTGPSFAGTWLDSTVTNWMVVLARWNGQNPQTGAPSPTTPWPTWTMWQYTNGVVTPGVGAVDGDVYNGTLAGFISNVVIGGGVVPPVIVTEPSSVAVNLGSNATFSVNATGSSLRYQWMFNQTNIAGATGTSFTLNHAQLTNAGGYSVMVSNSAGTDFSTNVFLAVLSQLTNTYGCVLAPPGMMNWWPADANPNDIFSTNKAVLHNGVYYSVGKQGQAFHFDGSTGYLTTGAASVPVPWTVCLWVNRENAIKPGAALMGDGTYELKLEQYNGTRQVGITQFGVGDYNFGIMVPTNVWTHVAFVGTSSGTTLYINGVLQATLTNSLPLPRAYIGAGYVNSSSKLVDYMMGSLDEILVFNRALSGSEIGAIHSASGAGLVRAPQFTSLQPMGGGQFGLAMRGQTGKPFTLYSSQDMVNWSKVAIIGNPGGSVEFIDTSATNEVGIYRATQP